MCRATRSRPAFTFAEVLICLYVLAVALLGIVATVVYCLQSQRGGEQRQLATRLAEDELTELTAAMRRDALSFNADHRRGRGRFEQAAAFEYAIAENTVSPDLKQVQVEVYFTDQAAERRLSLQEMVYNCAP